MRDKAAMMPESVALVVYDGVPAFEIGVVCDVFGGDYAQEFGVPWYRLTVCAATPSVRLDAGLRLEVPHGLDAIRTAGTVVVVPTDQADQVPDRRPRRAARGLGPGPAHPVPVHRGVRPGRGRDPGRLPGHHALGRVRGAGRALPARHG